MTFASAVICSVTTMVIAALMITAPLAGATKSPKTSSSTLKSPLWERHGGKVSIVTMTGGNGGNGISSSISGTPVNYGGGGTGGGGGNSGLTSGAPGTANTGGGGAGIAVGFGAAGAGGSPIVIISCPWGRPIRSAASSIWASRNPFAPCLRNSLAKENLCDVNKSCRPARHAFKTTSLVRVEIEL
jgi:hypothetical protein